MPRPKRSAAVKSSSQTLKTTKATSTAKTATKSAPLAFKASKITRWSEKKKEKAGEEESTVQTVEIEEQEVTVEVKVVPAEDEAASTTIKNGSGAVETEGEKDEGKGGVRDDAEVQPTTPRKRRSKRTIEDTQDEEPAVKRTKVHDDDNEAALPQLPSDETADPSSPPSLPSDASTVPTDISTSDDPSPPAPLPKRISRLLAVHSATISLLLVHYATHGASQPAILTNYLPQISRNAGTNVALTDLQRITTLSSGSLRLVRVERRGDAIELVNGVSAGISNLGSTFKQSLEKWWHGQHTAGRNEQEALDGIELAAISSISQPSSGTSTPKSTKSSNLLSKGQRRLQDLKSFTLTKQSQSPSPSPSPAKKENVPTVPGASVANRGSSLLERIRAKAAAAASAPPPPPPEVLQRRTALQTLECIIPILLQLTAPLSAAGRGGGGGKKLVTPSTASFPMTTLIANIKMSLGRPIASEDVERSLRVLADEVASEFVRIVEWKGDSRGEALVGVVFDRKGREKAEKWRYVEE
ncbi:hypothetical protein Dda_7697 [Drechslerella dactyloides]|uniref:DNA replication factor Cdt1 C-terminal domain-containing protein n=1 Tax=Drechslerella dactyloides TaxID=74499 RepID=A0AAD6IWZ4_DREDA|nr:hypothetical protein Dda_7697 [Drechslerella dactyloides]